MCSLMGKELEKNKALVEACELDTTVNLHFHHVTASTPPPPLLLSLSLSFVFYWLVTHWTSWKLH